MNKRAWDLIGIGIYTSFISYVVYLLVTGSDVLEKPMISEPYIPTGTLFTWMVLIFFPTNIAQIGQLLGVKKDGSGSWFYNILGMATLGGIFWGVVSYWLASYNWAFNFENTPMYSKIFWWNTYAIPVVSLSAVMYWWVVKVVKWVRRW